MKFSDNKRNSGFTVIELMIVLGIVAFLVALAYPSYVQYVRKANRGDAQQLLMNWAINQEIWRSSNTTYADETDLPPPTNDHYTFPNPTNLSATTYTLTATPTGDQLNDEARDGTDCNPLTMNQDGIKTPPVCWE